jgi:hypothetical protein
MSAILKSVITDAERVERQNAIDYSRASVRLEGYILSDEYEAFGKRFVEGDLTLAEYLSAVDELTTNQLKVARTKAG